MSNTTPVRTVIVGCGMIAAGGYHPRCQAYPHRIELVGYYDQDEARASALAERNGGHVYKSLDEVLNDPNVEAIVNLTIHISHYPVSLAALKAGKHVYSEKPISIRTDEANELVETAEAKGLKLACAPSAILGYVQQNVWQRIREGEIGDENLCDWQLRRSVGTLASERRRVPDACGSLPGCRALPINRDDKR